MLAAKEPLVVPMLLRLSHIKLSSYVVLVVSRSKGITLVFKTDPLQNVEISSSFDGIAVIQKFIQKEIEGQLRQMFKEDLPGIIHRLSQQWVKTKVETPYHSGPSQQMPRRRAFDSMSAPDVRSYGLPPLTTANVGLRQVSVDRYSDPPRSRRSSSSAGSKRSRRSIPRAKSPLASPPITPFDADDAEATFDPTYGLRPEGVPANSMFSSFGRLFAPSKGLADLAEDEEDLDSLDSDSASDISEHSEGPDWDEPVSVADAFLDDSPAGELHGPLYDFVPAVGGGTVSKPRILHSARASTFSESASTSTQRPIRPDQPHASNSFGYFSTRAPASAFAAPHPSKVHLATRAETEGYRSRSPDSASSDPTHSIATPSTPYNLVDDDVYINHPSAEFSNSSFSGSPPRSDPKIVLPHNNSIHQLSTLSHSNHTLSPYTRSLSHFTVRSVPPRGPKQNGPSDPNAPGRPLQIKARRKRTFKIGRRDIPPSAVASPSLGSAFDPIPASDLDAEDMDLYFPPSHETEIATNMNRRTTRKTS